MKTKEALIDLEAERDPKRDRRMNIVLAVIMIIFILFAIVSVYAITHNPPDQDPSKPLQGYSQSHRSVQVAHNAGVSIVPALSFVE